MKSGFSIFFTFIPALPAAGLSLCYHYKKVVSIFYLHKFHTACWTHFMPLVSFYTRWKSPKTSGFLNIFRAYRKRIVVWNGLIGDAFSNPSKNLGLSIEKCEKKFLVTFFSQWKNVMEFWWGMGQVINKVMTSRCRIYSSHRCPLFL